MYTCNVRMCHLLIVFNMVAHTHIMHTHNAYTNAPSSLRKRRVPVRIRGSFVGGPWKSRRISLASSRPAGEENDIKNTSQTYPRTIRLDTCIVLLCEQTINTLSNNILVYTHIHSIYEFNATV